MVIDDALALGRVTPEPTFVRTRRVLDHDRPCVERFQELILGLPVMTGRGGGELLFDDHLAVRDLADAAADEPFHDPRRIVNADGWVRAVIPAVNEWAGVADGLVVRPTELRVLAGGGEV